MRDGHRCRRPALVAILVLAAALSGGPAAVRAQPGSAPAAPTTPGEPPASRRDLVAATLAVVALAALGAGLYLGVRVDRIERDIEQAMALDSPIPPEQIAQKTKAGQRAAAWQWVGYGTALAAGAGVAGLLLWPDRGDERAGASPLITPTFAGASWRVVF